MSKIFIRVYCRLKPNFSDCQSSIYYNICSSSSGETDTLLIRAKPTEEFVNNKPESHTFIFKKIFDENSSQEYIYSIVGSPVIKRVLKGYNGTIFAYGQSGSGKTYTISGVSFDESSEAIVHRSLIQIFEEIEEISGEEYEVKVSFMEIYNEIGRDLLKETNEKIIFQEDEDGEIQLKNLSLHNVKNYKQFLKLYRFGENNRSESDTLLNQYSSRSHCILTVHLTIRDPVLNGVRRSKLHLVDLAGSERLSTMSNSQTNNETRHINLSLHYLEQVIVALGEKHRQHIPYRNSMMTTVLRDSLGGNCLTAMIATLSMNESNLDESISTCRFAQRVALVKNEARLNIFDENIETDVLQNELNALKHQMSDSTLQKSVIFSIKRMNSLSKEDSDECRNFIEQFIINNKFSCTSFIPIIRNPDKTRVCFEMMKKIILDIQTKRRKAEMQVHSMYERAIESRKNSTRNIQKTLQMNSNQQLLLNKDTSSTNTLATSTNTDSSNSKCKREDSKTSSDRQKCCQQICTTNEFSEKINSLENQFKTFRKELKRLHDKEYNKLSTIHKLVTMSEIQGKDVFKKLSDVEIKTIVNEQRMRDYKKKRIIRNNYSGYVNPFCKSDIIIASSARNIENSNSYQFRSITHIASDTCKDV